MRRTQATVQCSTENKDPSVANDANPKSEEGVKFNRVVLDEQAVDIGDLLLQQIREFKSFRSEFNNMKERQNQYESHVDRVMEVQLRNEDALQRDRSKELQQLQLQQQQQFELKQQQQFELKRQQQLEMERKKQQQTLEEKKHQQDFKETETETQTDVRLCNLQKWQSFRRS